MPAHVGVTDAELWVDDIRLGSPLAEVGAAMAVDARLLASDVGNLNVSFVKQDGQFHQINRDPTYRTTGTFQVNTNWRLDRFLPTSLGLSIPFTVAYSRSDVTPELLTGHRPARRRARGAANAASHGTATIRSRFGAISAARAGWSGAWWIRSRWRGP